MTYEQAAYDIKTLPRYISTCRARLREGHRSVDSIKVSREEILKYTARLNKAKAIVDQVHQGEACPECGEVEAIQDNGARGAERTWRCEKCATQWDRSIGRM